MPLDIMAEGMAAAAGASARSAALRARANTAISKPALISSRSLILAQGNVTPGAAGGWRVNDASMGVLSLDSTMRRRPGYDVTKLDGTGTTGGVFKSMRIATNAINSAGPIGLWLWSPVNSAGGLSTNLRWSTDTPAANPPLVSPVNSYEMDFTAEGQQRGCWSFLSVSGPTGKIFGSSTPNGTAVITNGAPAAGTIKQLDLIVSWNAATPAAERYLYIDNAEVGGKAKPMVVIGFDGYGDNATSVANKLAKFDQYGILGYVAGDGDSAVASASILHQFYDRGWDVVTQGMNHLDYGANPGNLSADYDTAVGILTGLGFTRSLDQFAYPYNSRNAQCDAILRAKGVRLGRTVLGNQRVPYNTTGTIDLLSTGAGDIDNRTAAQVQAWVDEAVASGSHLYLYGHGVNNAAGSSTNMLLSEFNTMMDYIGGLHQAGTLEVVTPTVFADRLLA
ncbi:polysaccharide deacetylase family protein [Novosphingobium rosa]|uniref:hypothetical protein n=1 Tax=Novosphingobium rosa TaxID=76978 RepID=UPI0008340F29|nr:hypothetical protein [Novosphingobium rosa]